MKTQTKMAIVRGRGIEFLLLGGYEVYEHVSRDGRFMLCNGQKVCITSGSTVRGVVLWNKKDDVDVTLVVCGDGGILVKGDLLSPNFEGN